MQVRAYTRGSPLRLSIDKFAFAYLREKPAWRRGCNTDFLWPAVVCQRNLCNHRPDRYYEAPELASLAGLLTCCRGPACQGFSAAGRRQHDDPRNRAFSYYLNRS